MKKMKPNMKTTSKVKMIPNLKMKVIKSMTKYPNTTQK